MTIRPDLANRIDKYWSKSPVYKDLDIYDGWIDLVDDLVTALEQTAAPFPEIVQIKTKFGGLRFYTETATPEQKFIIDEYEKKSYAVCERCGKSGRGVKIRYWYWTFCPDCENDEIEYQLTNNV